MKKNNKRSKSSTAPKRSTSTHSIFTKKGLLLGIVLALVLAILGIISYYVIKPIVADMSSRDAVIQARTIQEPAHDKTRDDRIRSLVATGALTSDSPAYSAKVDVCYISHHDRGWVAADWYQDCYLRYVDLFEITLSREQVASRLATTENAKTLFGDPAAQRTSNVCDGLYKLAHTPSLIYFKGEDDAKNTCKLPMLSDDKNNEQSTVKIHRTFDKSSIDQNKTYILMQSDNHYYNESLGCSGFIICSSPRAKPVTGF